MDSTYDPNIHTFVMFNPGSQTDANLCVLTDIILYTGDRVWIIATQASVSSEALLISDGLNNGFDYRGQCLLSVPATKCTFFTTEGARAVSEMMDADQTLLSYARG